MNPEPPVAPVAPPAPSDVTTTTVTERVATSGQRGWWRSFLDGFASDGGQALLSLVYEIMHITVSIGIAVYGLYLVLAGQEYGKEVFAAASGWLGRSMVGPIVKTLKGPTQ